MQGNNISLEEIKIARRDFENEEYLKALAILDNLVEKFAKYPFLSLRAALREIVNDLIGAKSDLQIENENSVSLRKARLAAKLGKNEEAVSILRRLHKEKQASASEKYLGLGVAGRRFDLELLNIQIKKSYLPNLAPELKGCAVEHLIALGIYDSCNQLFDKSIIGNYSLLKFLREIETADELSGLESKAIAEFAEDEISGINGWLSFDEAKLLASLASIIPKEEEIVEVGSFQGRSACALAMGAKNGYHSHVHSIDTFAGLRGIFPHSTLPAFESNLKRKKLHNFITIHKGTSEEVALHWKGRGR